MERVLRWLDEVDAGVFLLRMVWVRYPIRCLVGLSMFAGLVAAGIVLLPLAQ